MSKIVDRAPAIHLTQVRGGDLAYFPDADYWNAYADDDRERALSTTLAVTAETFRDSIHSAAVEELSSGSVSDWELDVSVTDEGEVKVSRFATSNLRDFWAKWETHVLSISGAIFTLQTTGALPAPF